MMQRWGIPIEEMIDSQTFLANGNIAPNLMDSSFQRPKVG
jgi:hypothetical protein